MIKSVNVESETDDMNKTHSSPLMLVLMLLAAVGLSIILQFVVQFAVVRLVSNWNLAATYYLSLFMHLLSFPFWMTCVVWLAALVTNCRLRWFGSRQHGYS